jgi:hypothetical protein
MPKANDEKSPCDKCRCPACDDDYCLQAHCDKTDRGLGCNAPDEDCPPELPEENKSMQV